MLFRKPTILDLANKLLEQPKDYKGDKLDPDVRFLLANERTLLAWIRTALALLAGGLALSQLGKASTSKSIAIIGILAMGGLMVLLGYVRFRAADTAIRAHKLPAEGKGPLIQVIAVLVFVVLLIGLEAHNLF